MSLLIPECSVVTVKHYFKDHVLLDEFCVAVLPLHVFIEKEFIEKFVKQGEHTYCLLSGLKINACKLAKC